MDLTVVVLLIKAAVEGIKTILGLKNEYVIRSVVFVVAGAIAWGYGLDVFAMAGLVALVEFPAQVLHILNAVVVGTIAMGGHDLMDAIRGVKKK